MVEGFTCKERNNHHFPLIMSKWERETIKEVQDKKHEDRGIHLKITIVKIVQSHGDVDGKN